MQPLYLWIVLAVFWGLPFGAAMSQSNPGPPVDDGAITIAGEVVYVHLEGGFWGIIGDDGQRYDALDLPSQLRRDGLRVRVTVRPMPETIGFHMWGAPVRVLDGETLSTPGSRGGAP